MKKYILFILTFYFGYITEIYPKITIVNSEYWEKTNINADWTVTNPEIKKSSNIYGKIYYNTETYTNGEKIKHKNIFNYIYFTPKYYNSHWDFRMPLTNLQPATDMNNIHKSKKTYWGIQLKIKTNGKYEQIKIWFLMKSTLDFYYKINDQQWEWMFNNTSNYWHLDKSPEFKISNNFGRGATILWDNHILLQLPHNIEEINYIELLIGEQAKIQVGQPIVEGESSLKKEYSFKYEQEIIKTGNYYEYIDAAYHLDFILYDFQAAMLATCYLNIGEINKCLEVCNELIKQNGEPSLLAHLLKGRIHEINKQYNEALKEYKLAEHLGQEAYTLLQAQLHTKTNQSKSTYNNQTKKTIPRLTK